MNTETVTVTMQGVFIGRLIPYVEGAEIVSTDGGAKEKIVFTVPVDADIDAAKHTQVTEYLAGGGNPRNKRGFATTAAALKRAVAKAIAAQTNQDH